MFNNKYSTVCNYLPNEFVHRYLHNLKNFENPK